jgi:acyl-CoA synthetase (NDP forming)
VHVFTAGFSESGEEEGGQLEERIRKIALGGGLNLIGPNCMGINVPKAKMMTLHGTPLESGPVAFLSQSGGHALQFIPYAQEFGIGFSKVISYGNGCIMDSTDFLEYLATDPETKIITMYVEGVRDGGKLLKQVREINRTKPVIVWKGGLSESGKRAAASHTGSLAGSATVWNAFFRQTGAVQVGTLDELADVTMTFLCLPPPHGRRVALLMGGGGRSVSAADLCNQEGLEVPVLTPETRRKLRNLIPVAGTSVKNPVDADLMQRDLPLFGNILGLAAEDPLIDIIIADLHLNMLQRIGPNAIQEIGGIMSRFVKQHTSHKPLVTVLGTWGGGAGISAERSRLQSELSKVGIGVYRTLPRACRALEKFIEYHEFQERSRLE